MVRFVVAFSVLICALSGAARAAAGDPPPQYDQAMWIEDSLAIADAVVVGTPRQVNESTVLSVEKVLWGNVEKTITLLPPCRCESGASGLWILLRRAQGYALINPDEHPISAADWERLAPKLRLRENVQVREEGETRTVQATMRIGGREVPWILTALGEDEALVASLAIDGREVLHRTLSGEGRLQSIMRLDASGDGFELALRDERPTTWCWYRSGKREGTSREYYTYRPEQLREEVTWHEGVRDGISRAWDEDGKLASETRYEQGLIAPVTRYRGPATTQPVASIYRTHRGAFYTAHAKIDELVKVGMTAAQVSEALKVDFSEKSGIAFPLYTRTRMLHIAFADGKVVSIRTADNSVCFDPPTKKRE